MVQVVRDGPYAMGRVSIWAQWLIIAAGVLLSLVSVVLLTYSLSTPCGRLLRRKLLGHRRPGSLGS
jgi:hypothetical protein